MNINNGVFNQVDPYFHYELDSYYSFHPENNWLSINGASNWTFGQTVFDNLGKRKVVILDGQR